MAMQCQLGVVPNHQQIINATYTVDALSTKIEILLKQKELHLFNYEYKNKTLLIIRSSNSLQLNHNSSNLG